MIEIRPIYRVSAPQRTLRFDAGRAANEVEKTAENILRAQFMIVEGNEQTCIPQFAVTGLRPLDQI